MSSDKLPNVTFWAVAGLAIILFQVIRLLIGQGADYNLGVAFGLELPSPVIFMLSGLFILIMAVWFFMYRRKGVLWAIALGLVVGGGVSNLLERIWFGGGVADYITFGRLGSFNLADVAIVVGIGLALYEVVRNEKA